MGQMIVKEISWERIHLYIDIEASQGETIGEDLRFYLVPKCGMVETELEARRLDDRRVRLALNVTNSGINRCIGNGNYKIFASADGVERIVPCFYGTSETLAAWSRNFNYRGCKGTYTISFMVDEYTEEPELQLLIYNAEVSTFSDKPDPVRAAKKKRCCFKTRVKRFFRTGCIWLQNLGYRLLRRLPRGGKKRVLFLSEKDESLALNMAALYHRMVERGLDKELRIEFSLRNSAMKTYSKLSTFRMTWKVARADVILVDDHIPLFDRLMLGEDKTLIQIWHAGAGFKGVGYSRWGHYGCPGPFSAHRQYSYCICDSKEIAAFFSEQFGILDEQIIPTGMPRMDQYVDPANRLKVTERLYETYPQFRGKKVILFAPTYRGQNRQKAYYPYELIDFEGLYRYCCQDDAVVLFKMHPWVSEPVPIDPAYADRFFCLNDYGNINELFYITDLLITDYSSSMYEFLLMNKPMLFFAFDKNQFATSRGFHRDYDSNVPGKICASFEELLGAICAHDYEEEKVARFQGRYFDHVDAGNCDRVIDWLILGQLPEEYRSALAAKRARIKEVRAMRFDMEA